MKSLELKIPPAFLMLIFMVMMWLIDRMLPMFKMSGVWQDTTASIVVCSSLACILAGIISFNSAKTTVSPTQPHKASSVVTTGIYGYTRNPMYLGMLLMLLALAIKLSNPTSLVMLPFFVVYMNCFQIMPEERALLKLFGDAYEQYLKRVRRWI